MTKPFSLLNEFENQDIKLPIALGKSISGNAVIGDLSTMPHLLIAGTTGSGTVSYTHLTLPTNREV